MGKLDSVRQLIVERVPNLKAMSREIGKNDAYLQQFVRRGIPVELPERVRKRLADKLDVSESLLRPESNIDGFVAAAVTQSKPAKSPLDDAMWSIWNRADPHERKLIVNIANTILASRKGD